MDIKPIDVLSQNKAILAELKRNPLGLTSADLVHRFGSLAYTRRIKDLRDAGNHIEAVWEYKYDERGKVAKKWRRYYYIA